MSNDYDLIVVGGGAAGFFAAIACAERRTGARILILEKGSQVLAKVRISGGGRCNVTHACYDPAELVKFYPRGAQELRGAFTRFQPRDMLAWLEAHGVSWYQQPDGCIFPASDNSQTIIDCFLNEAARLGITWQTRCGVQEIRPVAGGFTLQTADGQTYQAARVLLAAGGGTLSAYRLAAGLGHTIIPPVPSLFTFEIRDPRLDGLMGVSVPEARLSLPGSPETRQKKLEAAGPLLITHWGVSGPAVLRLSAWGARLLAEKQYHAALTVCWQDGLTFEVCLDALKRAKAARLRQKITTADPDGRLPRRLWHSLVLAAGLGEEQTWGEAPNAALSRLAEEITRGVYQISGKGVFKDEFVTCGGVSLKEVDFKTMQSRLVPGLYFAGEYLDIDGLTGGFNFQAAWTTGWLAGTAAAAAKPGPDN